MNQNIILINKAMNKQNFKYIAIGILTAYVIAIVIFTLILELCIK